MERTPLQEAVQFFHDQVGHRIIASAPQPSFARPDTHICSVCGWVGPGWFDERQNHRVFRCRACWSFYWPTPVLDGGGKDTSFAGTVKVPWMLHGGTLYAPPGKDNKRDGAFRARALDVGIDLYPKADKPSAWLARRALDPSSPYPILWAKIGMNKVTSIRGMRLSASAADLAMNEEGATTYFNAAALRQILEALDQMEEKARRQSSLMAWIERGLPAEAMQRTSLLRNIRAEGVPPESLLSIHDPARRLLRLAATGL